MTWQRASSVNLNTRCYSRQYRAPVNMPDRVRVRSASPWHRRSRDRDSRRC